MSKFVNLNIQVNAHIYVVKQWFIYFFAIKQQTDIFNLYTFIKCFEYVCFIFPDKFELSVQNQHNIIGKFIKFWKMCN